MTDQSNIPTEFSFKVNEPPVAEQGYSFAVEAVIEIPKDAAPDYLQAVRGFMGRMSFKQAFQRWLDTAHPGFGMAVDGIRPVFNKEGDRNSGIASYQATIKLTRPA